MYACLGVSRHAGQSNMKNEIDSKYLITIGNGLITFINVILLFHTWKNSDLANEDKITKTMRKYNI